MSENNQPSEGNSRGAYEGAKINPDLTWDEPRKPGGEPRKPGGEAPGPLLWRVPILFSVAWGLLTLGYRFLPILILILLLFFLFRHQIKSAGRGVLTSIDNGHFFRKPFKAFYGLLAVAARNLLFGVGP